MVADPRRRRPAAGARPVEAAECDGRTSTRSSRGSRSTPTTNGRSRRTGARPASSYRTDLVKERPTTWKEFLELATGPYSKKVTVLDSVPEIIGSMAMMLGYSYNTDDEGELDEVEGRAARVEAAPPRDHFDGVQADADLRQAVMAIGWNGDGAGVIAKKPAQYVIPEEGGEFWIDAYVIPEGREEPRRRARVDQLLLRAEDTTRSRPSTRTTARRSSGRCSRACWTRACSPTRPSSRRAARSRSSSRTVTARASGCGSGSGPSSRPRSDGRRDSRAGTGGRAGSASGAGGPRYPGWLALPAVAWYAAVLPRPARDHGRLQRSRSVVGLHRRRVRLEPRELPLPLGPALRRRLHAHVRAGARRDARHARRSASRSRTTSPATRSTRRCCCCW